MSKKLIFTLFFVLSLSIGQAYAQSAVKSHYPANNEVVKLETIQSGIKIHLYPGYYLTGHVKTRIINPEGKSVYDTFSVPDATKIDDEIATTGVEVTLLGDFSVPGQYTVIMIEGSISSYDGITCIGPTDEEYVFSFTVTGNKVENTLVNDIPIFYDVPVGHWARHAIEQYYSYGTILGYPDGSFRPDAYVNRAELATLISQTGGRSNIVKPTLDVDINHWAYKAIQQTRVFIPSDTKLYFKPDDLATREDVITALVKQAKYHCVNNGVYGDPNAIYYCDDDEGIYYNDEAKASFDKYIENNLSERFSDYKSIAPEKVKFINYAIDNRIISGYADNTIRPKDKVTRAELITMINNFNYMYPDDYEAVYYTGGF